VKAVNLVDLAVNLVNLAVNRVNLAMTELTRWPHLAIWRVSWAAFCRSA